MQNVQDEIRQIKPFGSLEEEALLNLERTAAVLSHGVAEELKPLGVTPTQYNVLRILRGAGANGLCRNDLRDRMVAQVPDVTRLLDRMEASGIIARSRDHEDRRYVSTRITQVGLDLLDELADPVRSIQKAQLGHLNENQLRSLIALLTRARTRT